MIYYWSPSNWNHCLRTIITERLCPSNMTSCQQYCLQTIVQKYRAIYFYHLPEENKGRTLPSTYYTESKGKSIQIYWIISKIFRKAIVYLPSLSQPWGCRQKVITHEVHKILYYTCTTSLMNL